MFCYIAQDDGWPMKPIDRAAVLACMLDFLRAYHAEYGFAPTHRLIAQHCYISKGTVQKYLGLLEAQGDIVQMPGYPRALRVLPPR